jgi:hypothetical protein
MFRFHIAHPVIKHNNKLHFNFGQPDVSRHIFCHLYLAWFRLFSPSFHPHPLVSSSPGGKSTRYSLTDCRFFNNSACRPYHQIDFSQTKAGFTCAPSPYPDRLVVSKRSYRPGDRLFPLSHPNCLRILPPLWATLTALFSLFIVIGVGYSRIYLQVHYLSDVLVGMGLAVLLVLGINALLPNRDP